MIVFDGVTKVYDSGGQQVSALNGIDLEIAKGEIFGVVGYSGAGKSSLIRCVNLLERPTTGRVLIDGVDITSLSKPQLRTIRQKIGMVFQHFNLMNSKTIFANVAQPLIVAGAPKAEIKERVTELLRFVGLEDKAGQYPDQLSGGQKQRVGIARALATQPSILLCDEATSALDPQTTSSILALLKKINEEYKITILLITHEMSVVREICHRVAVMEEGRVIETGSVFEVFAKPRTETAKNFVSTVMHNQIPAFVQRLLKEKSGTPHIYQIIFYGIATGQPLLSQISKKYQVDVNVLSGNITELQGIPFGSLIVELQGSDSEIQRALMFVHQQQVTVKEVISHAS